MFVLVNKRLEINKTKQNIKKNQTQTQTQKAKKAPKNPMMNPRCPVFLGLSFCLLQILYKLSPGIVLCAHDCMSTAQNPTIN